MGEDQDGSSGAAHGAQIDDTPKARPGLLTRLKHAITQHDTAADLPHARPNTPGLGNLRLKSVADVAIPRAEIQAAPVTSTLDEVIAIFRETRLTRLPVFSETLDNPVGMIHLKDLALQHGFNGAGVAFSVSELVRPVLFVPPSMTIGVLLQKMQAERTHMALVIDEYGGVDGLVTIEDLIEQVVGEIEDEHDVDEAAYWRKEEDGRYVAQARTPLDEFEAAIGLRLSDDATDDEVTTLGGLIFMLTGRVPVRGEVVKHPNGAEFEIMDADPRRIKRIRVLLPDTAPSQAG